MTTALIIIAWLLCGLATAYILRWRNVEVLRWHALVCIFTGMVGMIGILIVVLAAALAEYKPSEWWKERL